MATYNKLYKKFIIYLDEYVKINGTQTTEQIKIHAKNYAIQERGGVYDLTAKKYYCSLFNIYLLKNNIERPEEWLLSDHYDPDNEFTDDIIIEKLRKNWKKRVDNKILTIITNL